MTGTTPNRFRYTGQQYDDATGLYFLRARYYDPAIGRFLSQDPYPVNTGNPMELNRYVYTANNPVNYADPRGLFALETALQDTTILPASAMLKLLGVGLAAAFLIVAAKLVIDVIEDIGNPAKTTDKPQSKSDDYPKGDPPGGGGGMPGPGGGGGGGGFGDIVKRLVFAAINLTIGTAYLLSNLFKGADDTFQAKPSYRTQYEQTNEDVDEDINDEDDNSSWQFIGFHGTTTRNARKILAGDWSDIEYGTNFDGWSQLGPGFYVVKATDENDFRAFGLAADYFADRAVERQGGSPAVLKVYARNFDQMSGLGIPETQWGRISSSDSRNTDYDYLESRINIARSQIQVKFNERAYGQLRFVNVD